MRPRCSALSQPRTEFLIDKKGNVVSRYASTTKPESLAPEIEKLLAA